MYYRGAGVLQNYEQAARWIQMAAEQGLPDAQNYLSKLYYEGNGVPKDGELSFAWCEKALSSGDVQAAYNMGRLYLEGFGVERDAAKSMHYLEQAAAQGYQPAVELLEEFRNLTDTYSTPTDDMPLRSDDSVLSSVKNMAKKFLWKFKKRN